MLKKSLQEVRTYLPECLPFAACTPMLGCKLQDRQSRTLKEMSAACMVCSQRSVRLPARLRWRMLSRVPYNMRRATRGDCTGNVFRRPSQETTSVWLGMQHLDSCHYCLAILWPSCTQLPLQNMLHHEQGNLTKVESTYQHAMLSWTHVQVAAKLFETSSTNRDDQTSVFVDVQAPVHEVKHTSSSAAETALLELVLYTALCLSDSEQASCRTIN